MNSWHYSFSSHSGSFILWFMLNFNQYLYHRFKFDSIFTNRFCIFRDFVSLFSGIERIDFDFVLCFIFAWLISIFLFLFLSFYYPDVEKEGEHPNLENVPSNLYESVCMPDFNEFFQQQGDTFPVPDHNKNTTMNNNNTNGQQQQYMESKCFDFRLSFFHLFFNFIDVVIFTWHELYPVRSLIHFFLSSIYYRRKY